MSYEIRNIRNHTITSLKSYFFDANIWIYKIRPKSKPTRTQKDYSNFFQKIFDSDAKIIVNNLLLSEVINACLKIDYKNFCHQNGMKMGEHTQSHYKQVYRPSNNYEDSYLSIIDDLEIYLSNATLDNGNLSIDQILSTNNLKLDLCDNAYYSQFRATEVNFVTHDLDFNLELLNVLTYNRSLIDLYQAQMIASRALI